MPSAVQPNPHPESQPKANANANANANDQRTFGLVAGRVARILIRVPGTVLLGLAILVIAILTGTLTSAASEMPWFDQVGTGLPAFADGRWWTLATSPFFVDQPLTILIVAPVLLGGVGWAEWQFGTARTALIFVGGQLVGVLGAAAVLLALEPTGWAWSHLLATQLDVGPSAGAFTAFAFVLATLPSPWRLRARFALAVWAAIEILYIGQLANLEHALAITAGLVVSGLLPVFRRPAGRPTSREWRLLAFGGLIVIVAVQVIDLLVPYSGPLGTNTPASSLVDLAIDVIVVATIAHGIRRGIRAAWWVAVILAGFNVLSALLVVTVVQVLVSLDALDDSVGVLALMIPPAVLWTAQLLILLLGRGAFRVPMRPSKRRMSRARLSRDEAVDLLRMHGGGTISWMLTWAPNRYLPAADGFVGFQTHTGVAIALGDPVTGSDGNQIAVALQSFAQAAQDGGFIPCVFSASSVAAAQRPAGWRAVQVAEDTLVDLADFSLAGKRWQPVRTAVNRADREGISFRMCTLADEPWGVLAQVRAISEQWSGDKGLPEMRFTLGTVEEALDPEVRVGLAVDSDGTLHGITSWLPVYGAGGTVRGWTLDLMRRRDDGFAPVMEFLIGSAAAHFAEAGHDFISLSGAPLVRSADATEHTGPVEQVLDRIGELVEPLYGFRSLHKFKQKFQPRGEALTLLYRDEGDLPRIAMAITRAYLPDATVRDLLGSVAHAK